MKTFKYLLEVEKFTNELKKGKTNFSEKRFNDITNQFTTVGFIVIITKDLI